MAEAIRTGDCDMVASSNKRAIHHHDHGRRPDAAADARRLAWAAAITTAFMILEFAGGLLSGSLALLADAGHMLTDAAALSLAWMAVRLASRPPDARRSFGYQRLQVLAAFLNGTALVVVVGWIAFEAIQRLARPLPVDAPIMLAIATAGTVVNLVVFGMLRGSAGENLNVASAVLHVLGDLLGSLAAIAAGLVIYSTGWTPIDPLLSLLVAVLIIRSAWRLLGRSTHILLEGSPDWLDVSELRSTLEDRIPEIIDVHHVHCWSLTPVETLLTMHLTVSSGQDPQAVLQQTKQVLMQAYGIGHATIQIDMGSCVDAECVATETESGSAACCTPTHR